MAAAAMLSHAGHVLHHPHHIPPAINALHVSTKYFKLYRVFNKCSTIGNIGVNANFVVPHIYWFLLCLCHTMLVNEKLLHGWTSKYQQTIVFQS